MSDVKTVISVTDRSTKAVNAAAVNLQKIVNDLSTLAEGSEKVSQDIQYKQQELGQLENLYSEKLAEEKSKFRIRVLENEDSVLAQLLKARGVVAIEPSVVDGLRSELAQAKETNEEAVYSAVQSVRADAARELNSRVASLESAHKIETAELNAGAKASASRIADLEAQVTDLREQISAERQTRLEIAKADAGRQALVVNTGKQ